MRDEVVGDLEEAHRRRLDRHSPVVALVLTWFETADMAWALVRRRRRSNAAARSRFEERTAPGWFSAISWLDVKLSVRMLAKHPGLSFVSVVGMTVAVAIGASAFSVIRGMTASPLPLDEGDRIVTVQNGTEFGFGQAAETHLHALDLWRTEVSAFEEIAAYRTVMRNLITSQGTVVPGSVVEMTASGFRIARVPPLIGRYLDDGDEMEGAPNVAVIGHGVWLERFGGAPNVLGRTLQIGATPHIIVGVMPRDFAFPISDRVWTPLRLSPEDFALGQAPAIKVFARLTPDATLKTATLQVQGVAQRATSLLANSRSGIQARVFPYTQEFVWGPMAWVLYIVQALVSLILVVIAVNVAALVYARTVARGGEIAVRTALGASRGRIVMQLFAEALLLSSSAAVTGLLMAAVGLEYVRGSVLSRQGTPFWWDFSLSAETVAYGLGLAVIAAVIIGVVPALGATGQGLRARLQSVGSGTSGPRLGRTWTALIVVQIAAAVAILPVTMSAFGRFFTDGPEASQLPVGEVVVARLELDQDPTGAPAEGRQIEWQERYTTLRLELTRRLEARQEVSHVAYMGTPPWLDPDLPFEVEGVSAAPLAGTPAALGSASSGHSLGRSTVAPEIFDVVDIPVLAGRRLSRSDAIANPTSIVVNERFVELVLSGGSAVGRRVRFPVPTNPEMGGRSPLDGGGEPWYTIVGVIPSFPPHSGIAKPEAKAYLPLPTEYEGPLTLAIRVRGTDAAAFAGRLRPIVADVDPMLRLADVATLEALARRANAGAPIVLATMVGLATAVLLLAIAGLYALMSFTVARQHREIGIRIALGARPTRVLSGILIKAVWQLAAGVGVGLLSAGVFDRLLGGETLGGKEMFLLPAVAALMVGVGIMAAWGPARQGLSIQPTEALRAD